MEDHLFDRQVILGCPALPEIMGADSNHVYGAVGGAVGGGEDEGARDEDAVAKPRNATPGFQPP